MLQFGKKMLLAISLGAMTLGGSAAMAQRHDDNRNGWSQNDRRGDGRNDRRDDRRDDRRGDPRNDRRDDRRADRRDDRRDDRHAGNWKNWKNYDYNRRAPGARGYYAENYYRGGYKPVRVTRNTRIYRGNNGNYYCRRNDGTTGLIVGAALGGVVGNQLDRGGSNLLGTLLGAGAGGLLGREIDRGGVSCR
ncbi:MAG: glycine zipper 2TM domain-containing protein [Sphingobium sp.]